MSYYIRTYRYKRDSVCHTVVTSRKEHISVCSELFGGRADTELENSSYARICGIKIRRSRKCILWMK